MGKMTYNASVVREQLACDATNNVDFPFFLSFSPKYSDFLYTAENIIIDKVQFFSNNP